MKGEGPVLRRKYIKRSLSLPIASGAVPSYVGNVLSYSILTPGDVLEPQIEYIARQIATEHERVH